MANSDRPSLLEALRKGYQARTSLQHKIIYQAIAPSFPTLSQKKVKFLSFYFELRQGLQQIQSSQYPKHSFIIKFSLLNPQNPRFLQIMTSKDISLNEDQFACVLSYDKYINVQLLGQTSAQNQIAFWQSSQYFCSMPRKKFIEAMKSAEIIRFSQNQVAFFEGQQMTKNESGSGVFVVRKGQFGYFKESSKKQIQTFRFETGHVFGALEIMQQQKLRSMTARCKTQSSLVYHFSQENFKNIFLKYNSSTIYSKQNKLLRYLENKGIDMKKSRSYSDSFGKTTTILSKNITKQTFFGQTLQSIKLQEEAQRRAFPFIKKQQIKQTAGTTFFKSIKESEKIENQSLKKTNFWSLKKQGPLKVYPMISHRSNFISSQFKGLDKLFLNRRNSVNNQKFQEKKQGKNEAWKRDVIFSFYRESFYKRRQGESKMEL